MDPSKEQKTRAQEIAEENEQRFTNAFEYAAIGMALVSLEGRWLKVNRSVCKLLGYTEAELMKMTFQDVTHPDDLDKDLAYLHQMLRGEIQTYDMQKRYFNKSQKIVWVRLSVSMVRNHNREPSYFISQIEDITESKVMEEQLKENEQRLMLATTSAKLGVWDYNIETDTTQWDDRMYELYGVKREAFVINAKNWEKIVHPDDLAAAYHDYHLALTGDKEFYTEFRVIWPTGEVRALKCTAIVMRNKLGKPIRMIGINHDVTEDKKAFENLKLLNKFLEESRRVAETATLMKSRFLDIAAHELRTPVTSFSLLLQFTQKKLEKGYPVEMETLQRLRMQGERISHLVIDLLDVSRLERGVLLIQTEVNDITTLINNCVEDFKLRAINRSVTYSRPDKPINIKIDPVRIYQVVSNLLENAAKYTPEKNSIEISLEEKDQLITVSVADHGPGIPESQQAALFTVFSRGSTELTERSGGLGLGLFICRSIIELHGGTIDVKSIMGEGSVFSFQLPHKEGV